MWKYSKSLKVKSNNILIGHTHKKNQSKELQKVLIRTNELGLRGDKLKNNSKNYDREILIIGSSIPLGWGVKEENTVSNKLQQLAQKDDLKWKVHNAGVGNYNTERYVNNYIENLQSLTVDTIIILYFVNDTEILNNNYGNFFTRNFQTAVLIWKFYHSLNEQLGTENIVEYYKKNYSPEFEGYKNAIKSLDELSRHCFVAKKRCVLAMMPDIHQMKPYGLEFIHQDMMNISNNLGFEYIDLLPDLRKVDSKLLWNKYQDPHPNSLGHSIMANTLYKFIK
tara:strand:+ start:1073 stop:1912 length:840 start_codon:yes stop_codon:yes gene_type:complete